MSKVKKMLCVKPPSSAINKNVNTIRLFLVEDEFILDNPRVMTTCTDGHKVLIIFGTRFDDYEIKNLSFLFSNTYLHINSEAYTIVYHKDFFTYELDNIVNGNDVLVFDIYHDEILAFSQNKKCTTHFTHNPECKTVCFYRTTNPRTFNTDIQLIKYFSHFVGGEFYIDPNMRLNSNFLFNTIKNNFGD